MEADMPPLILVISDDLHERREIRAFLRRLRCRVRMQTDVLKAVQYMEWRGVDLVIAAQEISRSDLPNRIPGLLLLKLMRHPESLAKNIPFILLSGANLEDYKRAARMGKAHFVHTGSLHWHDELVKLVRTLIMPKLVLK